MSTYAASIVSNIFGWGYFLLWSSSMYPQPILNYRRHSVEGLSIDFVWLSWLGFKFYSMYTLAFYFWPVVQIEFQNRNQGQENLVTVQDMIFAVHCWVVTGFVGCQVLYYRKKHHILSWPSNVATIFFSMGMIGMTIWAKLTDWDTHALNVIRVLGYSKMALTAAKYIPQAWLNYRDKSTEGWSIFNVMSDMFGSVLGILQLLVDAWISAQLAEQPSTWLTRFFCGNESKLGLGFLSFAFDVTFAIQHFCLYRGNKRFTQETQKGLIKTEKELMVMI